MRQPALSAPLACTTIARGMIDATGGRVAASPKSSRRLAAQVSGAASSASRSAAPASGPNGLPFGAAPGCSRASGSSGIAPPPSNSSRAASRAACRSDEVADKTGSALESAKPTAALASLRLARSGSLINGSFSARANTGSGAISRVSAARSGCAGAQAAKFRPSIRHSKGNIARRIVQPWHGMVKIPPPCLWRASANDSAYENASERPKASEGVPSRSRLPRAGSHLVGMAARLTGARGKGWSRAAP